MKMNTKIKSAFSVLLVALFALVSGMVWAQSAGQSLTGGGGTPGGANTHVQYNDDGAFAGEAGMTYNAAENTLTVGSVVTDDTPGSNVIILNDNDAGITCSLTGGSNDIGLYADSNDGVTDSLMICNDAGVEKAVSFVGEGSWVLLDSHEGFTGQTNVELNEVDWDDTYDTVVIEFVGVYPSVAGEGMRIKTLDGSSTFTTNMDYSAMTLHASATDGFRIDTGGTWRTDTVEEMSNAASEALTGTARISVTSAGGLSGIASWVYYDDVGGFLVYQSLALMQVNAPSTGHYGFSIDMTAPSTTTTNGTLRFWGVPKL